MENGPLNNMTNKPNDAMGKNAAAQTGGDLSSNTNNNLQGQVSNQAHMDGSAITSTPPAGETLAPQESLPPVQQNTAMYGDISGRVNDGNILPQDVPVPADLAQETALGGGSDLGAGAIKPNNPLLAYLPIILLSITTVAGIICAVVFFLQMREAQTNLSGKINVAKEEAVAANSKAEVEKCNEANKRPYNTFAGPEDYGGLTFKYPKNWSVYIDKDASAEEGGDFAAYLNPGEVYPVSEDRNEGGNTLHALRVKIYDKAISEVQKEYNEKVEEKKLRSSIWSHGAKISGTLYEGVLEGDSEEGTSIEGKAFLFKKDDKTVMIRTDSMTFDNDFMKILDSLNVN